MRPLTRWSFISTAGALLSCTTSSVDGEPESIAYRAAPSGVVTLISGDPFQGGYDFSAGRATGLSGGDFYFSEGSFWANNSGQRGIVDVGLCGTVDAVATVPPSGYVTYGVSALSGHCYVALTHNEEHELIVFRVEDSTSGTATLSWKLVDFCYGLSDARQSLDCWLSTNANVAQHLVWEDRVGFGTPSPVAWSRWTNVRRDELRANFVDDSNLLVLGSSWEPDPLVDPPANQQALADDAFPIALLSLDDAWRLYVKTVAMSLAVELNQYVPWSVVAYDDAALSALFDSRHFLTYAWPGRPDLGTPPSDEGYLLVNNNYDPATHSSFQPYLSFVTPAPPHKIIDFVRGNGFVASTRRETVSNALEWTRRLHHFLGAIDTASFERHWQYRGPAPVSRTIDATVNASDNPNAFHYTAGCHGTSGFLHSVLRVLNIPVDTNVVGGHSLTRFMTEGLYLSHGDDPYIGSDIYGVPIDALLILESTFQSWYVTAPSALVTEGIGRGNPESMIRFLSGKLQYLYCNDLEPNADHAHSLVLTNGGFAMYPHLYSLDYLEHLPDDPSTPGLPPSLWDRLSRRVEAAGGCDAVLRSLGEQMGDCFSVTPVAERLDCNW